MLRRVLLGMLACGGLLLTVAQAAGAQDTTDCVGPAGDPAPGTVQWYERDQNNRFCATQGSVDHENPAYAQAEAEAQAAEPGYGGDPFREPLTRWNGKRGCYYPVSMATPGDHARFGSIYMPLPAGGRCPAAPPTTTSATKYPGIVVICELPGPVTQEAGTDTGGQAGDPWDWALEALAEQGYMVFAAPVANGDGDQDAVNWFLATKDHPDGATGNYNPWWRVLDRAHVGIAGHSGGGSSAITIGQHDHRISAIVAWDRARSSGVPTDITPRVPQMNINADYTGSTSAPGVTLLEPRGSNPDVTPDSRFYDCHVIARSGTDCMDVTVRATTHWDFQSNELVGPHSRYGKPVITYYTLAWFDRYLRGAPHSSIGAAATRRLLARRFDGSADAHSIGAGFFDPYKAEVACGVDGTHTPTPDCVEAGNVAIDIAGFSVADRLSFWYPSYYFLDGGALKDDDIRKG